MQTADYIDFITFKSKETTTNIVVMIHGYGSCAEDMVSICPLFERMPNTTFILPNAPFTCDGGFGKQWFPLYFSENDIDIVDIEHVKIASNLITNFIQKIANQYNVNINKIALFGFSQGGILSLFNGLHGKNNYGAIICHSGAYYGHHLQITNKMQNILLIHGKDDNIVPIGKLYKSIDHFKQEQVKFEVFIQPRLMHSVDINTIEQTQSFLLKYL